MKRIFTLVFAVLLLCTAYVGAQQPPTITSFSPANATTGQTVTITGTGFSGATEVTFGGSAAKSFIVDSPTSIKAVVANGTSGDVSVTATGGTGSKAGFTFNLCLAITAPADITVNAPPGATGAVVTYTTPVGTNPCDYPMNYGYTGAMQTYTVPAGIYVVNYNLSGGAGGSGIWPVNSPSTGDYYDIPGGYGGNITGTLAVTPGTAINVFVGDKGRSPHYGNSGSSANGGGNYGAVQGGNLYAFGGCGGGATDLRIGGTALTDRVGVAGGGGGGGGGASPNSYSTAGGAGGGLTGVSGYGQPTNGGGGGSQIAGGIAGGAGACPNTTAGTLGNGGDGGSTPGNGNGPGNPGGGGGGGYYGGGGGYWAGGGGGSNYPTAGTQGANPGSGQAIISYSLGGVPSTTRTQGLASGASFPVGTTNVTYTVTDGLGNSKSASFKVTVNRIATITDFTPTNAASGQTVTITGTDFNGATAVRFGGTPAASFTVVSSTTITAVVAAGTSGNVSVTTPASTVAQAGFTFLPPPTISSFSPATAATGQTVAITGSGFTGVTAVTFGGSAAKSFTVESPTSIKAVVANGTSGDVSVTSANGTGNKAGFTFNLCLEITAPADITVNAVSGATGAVVNYTTPVGTNPCGSTQNYGYFNDGSGKTYQTYQVPPGITSVNYNLSGGAGGAGFYNLYNAANQTYSYPRTPGGGGGNITGTLAVTPGQILYISVGSAGSSSHGEVPGYGYYNGGGAENVECNTFTIGGGGGGATEICIGGTALANRIVVAGGGGGAGGPANSYGGGGGGLTGGAGQGNSSNGGGGGSQNGGGAAGAATSGVTAGTLGNGGSNCFTAGNGDRQGGAPGGGGGGGYYGGGGGYWAGGGGSSYANVGTNGGLTVLTSTQGTNPGSGSATISYSLGGVPNTTRTEGLASGAIFPVGTTTVTYVVTDGLGNSKSASFKVKVNRIATITDFTPAIAASGQTVTITGTDFTEATAVRFGGTPAASFTVVSSTTITAVVAAGTSGSVSLTTPASIVSMAGFTYTIIPPSTISSVSVPADGTYVGGQNLDFTVNYNENVTVNTTGGTPYIPITLNTGGTVHANYVSGSGSAALVFRYTVVSGNEDLDGVTLGSAITTHGGTIGRSEGGSVLLTLNNSGNTTHVNVDATAPVVNSIVRLSPLSSSTNATSITYRVTFNENVSGVDLNDFLLTATGASAGTISSVSASGGNSFDVTVNSITGDGSLRLDMKSSGTGIMDDAGNAVSGGFTSGNAYTIDQTAATVSSVGVPANGRYTSGQNVDLVVNYGEAVTLVTTDGTPYIPVTLSSGRIAKAVYVSGSGSTALTFRYIVADGDYDNDGIAIGSSIVADGGTIKDAAGNDATLPLNGMGSTADVLVDAVIAPTTQAKTLASSDVQSTQMTFSWTNGNGSNRAVFVKQASSGTTVPDNNTTYTPNTIWGSGTQISSTGWYCVYNGPGSSVTVTGLSMGTDYIAEVFEYNGPSGFEKYITSTSANNSKSQATLSCTNPTSGGQITGDQIGCIPLDVTELTSTASPVGYVGTLEYKWQKSTTSNISGFEDIDNSNSASYDPGSLNVTTWYKRLARVTCMSSWTGASESNAAKMTVIPASVGGSITRAANPITYGDVTGTLTLSGHTGMVVKWQKRLGSDSWSDLENSSETYSETPTSAGIWQYRVLVKSGTCTESYSDPLSIVVAPKALAITAENKTKVYDGSVYTSFTATYDGFITGESPAVLGGALFYSGTATSAVNAGTDYTIIPGGLTSGNYDITFVAGKLNITKKTLVITATGPAKEYGTPLISETGATNFTASATGVGKEVVTGLTLTPDNAGFSATTPAGSAYVVAPSRATGMGGFVESNYSVTYIPYNGVVSKKALMITAENKSKNYGEALPTLTINYTGLVNGDLAPATLPSISTITTASSPVATYPITAKGAADPNYIIRYSPGILTVNKLALLVTANNVSKVYGSADPLFTYINTPALIGRDSFTGVLTRAAGENVGSYAINIGTLSAGTNYSINFVSKDLNIDAKPLTIGGPALVTSKTYDGSVTANVSAGALAGVIPGDENNLKITAGANYINKNVGTGKTINVIYSLTGSSSGNYTKPVDYSVSNGEIVAKQVTVSNTAITTNKMYDGTTTAMVEAIGTLSGVETADAANVNITATASYNDAKAGASKTITVVYALGGSAASNYLAPANLLITNTKISEKTVLNTLQTPTASCAGSNLELNYTVLAGTPVQYQILFGQTTLSAGFQNIRYMNLATSGNGVISILVPPETPNGNYQASLQMRNELGVESDLYIFQFVVNLSSEYIIAKFDDVVLCDNRTNSFSSYQWYKNGQPIGGAIGQYYNDPEGLIGSYSIKLKTVNGQELFTCAKVLNIPKVKKVSVSVFPNPMKANQESIVKIQGLSDEELQGAVMTVYSIQGISVYSTRKVEQLNSLTLQSLDGSYVGHIITAKGNDYVYRILIVK